MTISIDELMGIYINSKLSRWLKDACSFKEVDEEYAVTDTIETLNIYNEQFACCFGEYIYPDMEISFLLARKIIDFANETYENIGINKRVKQVKDAKLKELFKKHWNLMIIPKHNLKNVCKNPQKHKCDIRKLENSIRKMF